MLRLRFFSVACVLTLFSAPALADDAPEGPRPPLRLAPRAEEGNEAPPPPRSDERDAAPRLGVVDSAFGMAGGRWVLGLQGDVTAAKKTATVADQSPGGPGGEGGLIVGYAPIERLTIHALLGRDIDAKWSPTLTVHLRFFGSAQEGFAMGALARYKTEGFTEAGGEAELGLTMGYRTRSFYLDTNLIGGVGVEEGEVGEFDGELKARIGYTANDILRFGAVGQVRDRLAGDRALAGGRKVDAMGGPELLLAFSPFVVALSGGPTTVHVAEGVGGYGMLTLAALVP